MKRIIYIGNKLAQQGTTVTSVETLGKFLSAEEFEVLTASTKKNQLLRLQDMLQTVLKNSKKADYVLIDTYSTLNFWYAFAVSALCQKLSIPYIPILRGGKLPERIAKWPWVSNLIFKNAYKIVAPSAYLLNAFHKRGYKNLVHIPNTIQIKNYPFLLRKKIAPKLLWVRSFAEIYNPQLALKIFEILQEQFPEAQLCMVGPEKDGSLATCKRTAAEKALPVIFTEKLEKEEWIKLSKEYDIFINTTNFDNTPVSLIEAMALGLPIVTTNVGGIPYLVSSGEEAVMVLPNNAEAFVFEIEKIIENPDLAARMTKAARKKAESFDWEIVKKDWHQLLG